MVSLKIQQSITSAFRGGALLGASADWAQAASQPIRRHDREVHDPMSIRTGRDHAPQARDRTSSLPVLRRVHHSNL